MSDLSDIYSDGAGNLRCRRCDREGRPLRGSLDTKGKSLGEITEWSVKHVAEHANDDVKHKAPVDDKFTEVRKVLDEVQAEVTEFSERLGREYGPRLQKAVTDLGLDFFFKR